MHTLRAIVLGLFGIIVAVVSAHAQLATSPDDHLVKASYLFKYTRYYAPYAIQAAAAYLPISEFESRRGQSDQEQYGADVNYTVQSIFLDDQNKIRTHARDALKSWQYQFGSDSYLSCYDPADSACQAAFRNRGWSVSGGPSFQVWARKKFPNTDHDSCTEVSIAFRGTTGGASDWLSNLDRLGSPYDDYYHQLRRNIDGIISSIANLDCYKRAKSKPQIVSTGHSLGGGLAQLAALSNKTSGPRIAKVFAFDPSPVTGARLVDTKLREANAQGLTVDRIYQEGEVLSYARSAVQEYPSAKSGCNPIVRTVKVDALPSGSAVQLHGMAPLAGQLVQLSYDGDTKLAYATPPTPKGCGIRYQPPIDDDSLVASARTRSLLAVAQDQGPHADQLGATYAYMRGSTVIDRKLRVAEAKRLTAGVRRGQGLSIANYQNALVQAENIVAFSPLPRAE